MVCLTMGLAFTFAFNLASEMLWLLLGKVFCLVNNMVLCAGKETSTFLSLFSHADAEAYGKGWPWTL
jgi:hypothetical protein